MYDKIDTSTRSLDVLVPGVFNSFNEVNQEQLIDDYAKIAKFAGEIGVPFCVEYSPYYQSPHAVLHEIGHWAVKPNSYIDLYRSISRSEFSVVFGRFDLALPDSTNESTLHTLTYYDGNNDRMPDLGLPDIDGTANEKAVRAWTRGVIDYLDLSDPLDTIGGRSIERLGIGDSTIDKASSWRTYAKSSIYDPMAIAQFERFGFNPQQGEFRPDESTLIIANQNPKTFDEF